MLDETTAPQRRGRRSHSESAETQGADKLVPGGQQNGQASESHDTRGTRGSPAQRPLIGHLMDQLPGGEGINRESATLVAFMARWCLPGRRLAAKFPDLRAAGTQLIEVDVDDYPEIADAWKVVALPTIVLVEEDRERRRWVGAVGPGELAATESSADLPRGMRRRRR